MSTLPQPEALLFPIFQEGGGVLVVGGGEAAPVKIRLRRRVAPKLDLSGFRHAGLFGKPRL